MNSEDNSKIEKQIRKLTIRGMSIPQIAETLKLSRVVVRNVRVKQGFQDNYTRCSICKRFRKVIEFEKNSDRCKLCAMKEQREKSVRSRVAREVQKIERTGAPGNFVKKRRPPLRLTIENIDFPAPRRKKDSLKKSYPQLSTQWHDELNCGYRPEDFGPGSKVAVWWKCPSGPDHIFQGPINNRTRAFDMDSKVGGCPFCRGFKASVTNCLANYKNLSEEWLSARNGSSAEDVVAGSKKSAWWRCSKCSREWKAPPCDRTTSGQGCPSCGIGLHTDLRLYPIALKLFDRERNKDASPYALRDKTKYWWKCDVAVDHRWYSGFSRTSTNTCPYCRGNLPSSTNNLALRPDISSEFHPSKNGSLKPRDVTLQSRKSIWWKCPVANDHEWKAAPRDRIRDNHSCPYCMNRYVSISNCLSTVSPSIAKEWLADKNGLLEPDSVMAVSTKLAWWKCKYGHEYQMKIRLRVLKEKGCPLC